MSAATYRARLRRLAAHARRRRLPILADGITLRQNLDPMDRFTKRLPGLWREASDEERQEAGLVAGTQRDLHRRQAWLLDRAADASEGLLDALRTERRRTMTTDEKLASTAPTERS